MILHGWRYIPYRNPVVPLDPPVTYITVSPPYEEEGATYIFTPDRSNLRHPTRHDPTHLSESPSKSLPEAPGRVVFGRLSRYLFICHIYLLCNFVFYFSHKGVVVCIVVLIDVLLTPHLKDSRKSFELYVC